MPEMLRWDTEAKDTISVLKKGCFFKFLYNFVLFWGVSFRLLIHSGSVSHPRSCCISVINGTLSIVYISDDYNCTVFMSLLR